MRGGNTMTETAIILVTDLQGSTELRSRVGEEFAEEVRREHDRLLAEAVRDHAGVVVKGLGDGLLARFDGASDAVAAAVAMQQAVDRYSRANIDTPLAIRIGISAGDVSLEDDDCFGTPVIEASRLCTDAGGGQILVAELVRLLARGRGGHEFSTVGERELKGLAETVMVDEVMWKPLTERDGSAAGEPLQLPLPAALAGSERFPYAGRSAQRELVWTAWKQSTGGQRQIVLLSGEPGMGKTRLASEVARRAHAEGAVVLFGRADEDVDTPYRPVVEAVRHLVEHAPPELLDAHLAACGPLLQRLLPDLAARAAGVDSKVVDENDRTALFDAVVDLLARASQRSPVVLVLDDLHWADHPSLLWFRHLARANIPMAVTVIGTYRDTDLVRTHPLALVLADLRREPDVCRLALDGLDEGEISQLMLLIAGDNAGDRTEELATAISGETGGNPFFVGEVLLHLAESGAIYQGDDGRWTSDVTDIAELGVPEGVREVVGRRLSALSDEANEALRVASVLGFEFDAAVVGEILDVEVDELVATLEVPMQRGLLAEASALDRYRFPHALVRQTLYEELTMSRRIRLHARAADVLEATGRGALEERAHHAVVSAAVRAPERAVALATAAAELAMERLAFEQAANWYRRALEAEEIVEPPDPARRARLLIGLVIARNEAGEAGDARAEALQAAQLARKAGDRALLARAAINYGGQYGAWLAYDDTAALPLIDEALAALDADDEHTRAHLLLTESAWRKLDTDATIRPRLVTEAAAIADRLGDPQLRWRVLAERLEVARDEVEPDVYRALADAGDAFGAESPSARAMALYPRLFQWGRQGDLDACAAVVRSIAEIADETGNALARWMATANAAALRIERGHFDEARALSVAAAEAGEVVGITADLVKFGQLTKMLELQARWAEFGEMWHAHHARFDAFLGSWPISALLAETEGDTDRAAIELTDWFDAIDSRPAMGRALNLHWTSRFAAHVPPATAEWALAELEPWGDRWMFVGAEIMQGSAALSRARYAHRAGHVDRAVSLYEQALASHERAGEVPTRAHIELELATVLADRDGPGDSERVLPLAASALATATALGLASVEAGATALV